MRGGSSEGHSGAEPSLQSALLSSEDFWGLNIALALDRADLSRFRVAHSETGSSRANAVSTATVLGPSGR